MAPSRKRKSKKNLIITIIVLVVIVGLIIFRVLAPAQSNYSTVEVENADIETYYTFSGSVESKNTQNVLASSVIQISEIYVEEGDIVEKDDDLFKTSMGTKIKAEVDGTVSSIYVKEDQQVMAGASLCDIYDFENLQISIKVDEYDLSSISEDKEVSVYIAALDKTIVGTVSKISDTAANLQGVAYFSAVVDLPEDPSLKVGMTAEAKILNNQALDVLTIPVEALQFDENDETYVMVQDENENIENIYVTTGINDGIIVEITEGLSLGDEIVYEKSTGSDYDSAMYQRPGSQED